MLDGATILVHGKTGCHARRTLDGDTVIVHGWTGCCAKKALDYVTVLVPAHPCRRAGGRKMELVSL